MAKITVVNVVLAALCFTGVGAWPYSKRQALSLADVQRQALDNTFKVLEGTISDGLTNRPSTCNKDTVAVRKE
jgi:tyrosinase